ELVVDPFFGSGSTLVAAKNLNRQCKGNDISSSAHEHISQRADFGS
ncbi:DNA methylase N-4, partial [Vibrio parahaemolyticus]